MGAMGLPRTKAPARRGGPGALPLGRGAARRGGPRPRKAARVASAAASLIAPVHGRPAAMCACLARDKISGADR